MYLNTKRETTILLYILEGGEGVWAWLLSFVVVVLSLLEGEGGGSFVSADTPSVIVPHWRPASFLCAIVAYPRSHVSLSLSHVPRHCRVSLPCRCPLPSLLLSRGVVVGVPSL